MEKKPASKRTIAKRLAERLRKQRYFRIDALPRRIEVYKSIMTLLTEGRVVPEDAREALQMAIDEIDTCLTQDLMSWQDERER